MDYREEYLKLKQKIINENKQGSGHLNSLLINELSCLSFVVDDKVLGDDIHAIILSLVEEFNKIAECDLKHNLELSQYYAVSKSLMDYQGLSQCDNCEIVLKYIDTTVCITNSRFYKNNKGNGKENNVECNISRGLIRFYIKQKIRDVYKYTKIHVVKIQMAESLQPFKEALYQNNDEINRLEEVTNIAISKGHSYAILKSAQNGKLQPNTTEDILNNTKAVNNIISETKKASAKSQLNKINNERIISNIPDQEAINAANAVANIIMNTNAANNTDITTIMVPGNEPIPLQSDTTIHNVPAIIDNKRTFINNKLVKSGIQNTLNSKIVNNRASIAVDANLAVVPTKNIITDKNIDITQPSMKSKTSLSNKLANAATMASTKVEDIASSFIHSVEDATSKLMDMLKGNKDESKITDQHITNPIKSTSAVIPVSKNLSIMTNVSNEYVNDAIPVPKNDSDPIISKTGNRSTNTSHTTVQKRFENKILKANGSVPVSLNQSKLAVRTVKNGNISTAQIHENSKSNQNNITQLINKKNTNTEISYTNGTISSVIGLPTQQKSNLTIEPSDNNKNKFIKLTENSVLSEFPEISNSKQKVTPNSQFITRKYNMIMY